MEICFNKQKKIKIKKKKLYTLSKAASRNLPNE